VHAAPDPPIGIGAYEPPRRALSVEAPLREQDRGRCESVKQGDAHALVSPNVRIRSPPSGAPSTRGRARGSTAR